MKTVIAKPGAPIEIGRTGENNAIKVLFQDILPGWKEAYGEGLVSMVYKRPKDKYAYPVVCLIENNGADVSWVVSRTDLENSGLGKLELIYTVNDTVAISETYPVMIKRSISGESGSEPPEDPGKTWFEDMNDKVNNLEKREMIVVIDKDNNCNYTFEEIKNACLNPEINVVGRLELYSKSADYHVEYANGIVMYNQKHEVIMFTWIWGKAQSSDNYTSGWYTRMTADGKIVPGIISLENSLLKDTSKILDPTSKIRYPSTKIMVDYVNSQILAGKEIFVVNWTESPELCEADKTYAEIKAALENPAVTVVGKWGYQETATHEITIGDDGRIWFRFVYYDPDHGTMENYFYLEENEYGNQTMGHPVSQQDWAENDENSASYVKNRPGGYSVETAKTATVAWTDRPSTAIITDPPYNVGTDIKFYGYLITEDIEGFEKALQNNTVVVNGNDYFKSLIADAKWIKTNQTYVLGTDYAWDSNIIHCIAVILEDGVVYDGLTYPKKGIYAASAYYPGSGAYDTKGFSSISWSWTEENIVEIPLKYQEKETLLCTFTSPEDGVVECDKTFDELATAYEAGKNIIGINHIMDSLPVLNAVPYPNVGPTGSSFVFVFKLSSVGINLPVFKIAVTPNGCKLLGFLLSGSADNLVEPICCNFTFDQDTGAYDCDIDHQMILEIGDMGLPVIGIVDGALTYFDAFASCFINIYSNEVDSLEAVLLTYNTISKKWDMGDTISLGGSSDSGLFIITEKADSGGQGYTGSSASYTEMLAALDSGKIPVLVLNNEYHWLDTVDRENNQAYFCAVTYSDTVSGVRLIRRRFWESKISDSLSNIYDAYSPAMKFGYRQNGYVDGGQFNMKDTPVYLYMDEGYADGNDNPVYPLTKITNSSRAERQYGGIQYIEQANGHKFVYRQFTFKKGNSGNMDMKELQIPEPSAKTDDQTQEVGIDTATGKLYTKPAPDQVTPVFYIYLTGTYPNFTCDTAMADIVAAYNAGQEICCKCTMGDYTAVLPLFLPMPETDTWIFSGAGALDDTDNNLDFAAQSLTIAIVNGTVKASNTTLATADQIKPAVMRVIASDVDYSAGTFTVDKDLDAIQAAVDAHQDVQLVAGVIICQLYTIDEVTGAEFRSVDGDRQRIYVITSGSTSGMITTKTMSSLPAVTTADDGKFLRVVDGEWSATSIPSANGVIF